MSPNFDEKTGCAYGVISSHSLSPDVEYEIIDESTDTLFDESKKEFETKLRNAIEAIRPVLDDSGFDPVDIIEEMVEIALDHYGENYENDNPHWVYETDEYRMEFFQDLNAWYVTKSPYFAFCGRCSPCCPGAGNLDTSGTLNSCVASYALDKTFFKDEKLPYNLYSVETKELIQKRSTPS